MSSLEELLAAIRQNLPAQKVDYPEIPTYEKQGANLKDKFIVNLGLSGGESYDVGSIDEAKEIMQQNCQIYESLVLQLRNGREANQSTILPTHGNWRT